MPTPRRISNAAGLEKTIKALAERIGPSDEATVALARGLATAVDAAPDNAALWREYRAAVSTLLLVGTDQVDDDTAGFLLSIRTPSVRPEVVDKPDIGPGNDRRRNGRGGGKVGVAADAVATPRRRRGGRD